MAEIYDVFYNGIEMKYAKFGKGERNLIILPGLSVGSVAVSANNIEKMYSELCEEYTCYLFDRRTNPPSDYSINQIAEDTLCIIQHIGIEKGYYYGASQGAMITLDIAVNHSEAVIACVIASTADKASGCMSPAISDWIRYAKEHNRKALAKSYVNMIYSESTAKQIGEIIIMLSQNFTDEELDCFVTVAKATEKYDLSNDLDRIKAPVLVVASEGDRVFGTEPSKRIAAKTGGELYIYPDCYGHAVYDEAPDFTNRLYHFFAKH